MWIHMWACMWRCLHVHSRIVKCVCVCVQFNCLYGWMWISVAFVGLCTECHIFVLTSKLCFGVTVFVMAKCALLVTIKGWHKRVNPDLSLVHIVRIIWYTVLHMSWSNWTCSTIILDSLHCTSVAKGQGAFLYR